MSMVNFINLNLFLGITLIGLLYIPKKLRIWEPTTITYQDDENAMFLKKMNGFKKRRKNPYFHPREDMEN